MISSGIMIKPDPDFKINLHNKYVKKDLKYLDPLHTALKCCYMRPIELSTSFIESSQFKEIVPIDSCCPILNSKGQCVPELAYKNKCDEVYYKKVSSKYLNQFNICDQFFKIYFLHFRSNITKS